MNNIGPLLLILVGLLVARGKRPPSTQPTDPSTPTPSGSPAWRAATPLGETGLDFSGYPGRPGARGGGIPAMMRDWDAGIMKVSAGTAREWALASVKQVSPEHPTHQRSKWLAELLTDYIRG